MKKTNYKHIKEEFELKKKFMDKLLTYLERGGHYAVACDIWQEYQYTEENELWSFIQQALTNQKQEIIEEIGNMDMTKYEDQYSADKALEDVISTIERGK
jgi:hypothetical protein